MTEYANNVHPIPPDRCADDCDDQLPLIARVGRGPKGDSARITVSDNCFETYLEGGYYDQNGVFHTEWKSENINGGELSYQYNLRPYTIPRTFTITFVYRRPGRHEWSWTTPAIPYIWSVSSEDGTQDTPDHIVGSGVATLFVKSTKVSKWNERLNYPIDPGTKKPYPREFFNAPDPLEAWSATITYGKDGDIDVPDFDDLAKVLGISKSQIFQILEGDTININGIQADNIIDYINKLIDKKLGDNDTIWKTVYPVGSLYLSYNSTSPETLFGGKWTQITGRFLRANNDTNTGGEDTHSLTQQEMPLHSHSLHSDGYAAAVAESSNLAYASTISPFAHDSSQKNYTFSFAMSGPVGTSPAKVALASNTQSIGGNVPFNNMPAYQDIYVWRRTA